MLLAALWVIVVVWAQQEALEQCIKRQERAAKRAEAKRQHAAAAVSIFFSRDLMAALSIQRYWRLWWYGEETPPMHFGGFHGRRSARGKEFNHGPSSAVLGFAGHGGPTAGMQMRIRRAPPMGTSLSQKYPRDRPSPRHWQAGHLINGIGDQAVAKMPPTPFEISKAKAKALRLKAKLFAPPEMPEASPIQQRILQHRQQHSDWSNDHLLCAVLAEFPVSPRVGAECLRSSYEQRPANCHLHLSPRVLDSEPVP